MEIILANAIGQVRRGTLYGREHLIVPVTMIVPGVLNGSRGPVYYPPEENGSNPSRWNGMPVVVYHPRINGQYVSARDPDIINGYKIGEVYRARADRQGNLKAEAWLDSQRTQKVDNRILNSLDSGERVEVSTGLNAELTELNNAESYNGKEYLFIARNYEPDHLAVLPDQKGACSVADGCGLLANTDYKTLNANWVPLDVVNPRGEWEPPDAGDAPEEVKRILKRVYSDYRDKHPSEDPDTKAMGAKMAWGAVRKAGWEKDMHGKWHKVMHNSSSWIPLEQE